MRRLRGLGVCGGKDGAVGRLHGKEASGQGNNNEGNAQEGLWAHGNEGRQEQRRVGSGKEGVDMERVQVSGQGPMTIRRSGEGCHGGASMAVSRGGRATAMQGESSRWSRQTPNVRWEG